MSDDRYSPNVRPFPYRAKTSVVRCALDVRQIRSRTKTSAIRSLLDVRCTLSPRSSDIPRMSGTFSTEPKHRSSRSSDRPITTRPWQNIGRPVSVILSVVRCALVVRRFCAVMGSNGHLLKHTINIPLLSHERVDHSLQASSRTHFHSLSLSHSNTKS